MLITYIQAYMYTGMQALECIMILRKTYACVVYMCLCVCAYGCVRIECPSLCVEAPQKLTSACVSCKHAGVKEYAVDEFWAGLGLITIQASIGP
jgi:hypothetical protein